MNRTRRNVLIAGLALIGLTNAIALGGAAYNRAGDPGAILNLSERELRPPYGWRRPGENSGLALQLLWRVPPGGTHAFDAYYFSGAGGMPDWLNAQKMRSLGFDMERPAKGANDGRGYRQRRQLPREVFVVLELEGPAYRAMLERAAAAARDMEARNVGGNGKRDADEMMAREMHHGSRLFAVDAGLDRAALRSLYPDRTRHAIVHGKVHPAWNFDSDGAAGSISNLSAALINVPLELRNAFDGAITHAYAIPGPAKSGYEARLAFGKRLEPWLVSATRRK